MTLKFTKCILIAFALASIGACTPPPIPNTNGLGDPAHIKEYHRRDNKNLWVELRNQFTLADETTENKAVRKQINWFVSHPTYFKQVAEQAKPYLYYIFQQVKRRNLPAEFTLIPMVESEYDPYAYSHAGAAGLWQMMPGTASGFGLRVNWWYDGRRDIIASTNSALDYLSYLGTFFHQDWLLAIAAYDSGEGTVAHAMERNMKQGKPIDFWHLSLSRETTSYIPKLLALATIIKHPEDYPVDLPFIKNAPYLTKVDVGSQIDLTHAAKLANLTLQELSNLNPGFNRWATDPNGPHYLLLPVDKAKIFKQKIAKLSKEKRVTWLRYKVKQGDALLIIAKHHKTTVPILQNVNRLKDNTIHPGQTLLIPSSSNKLSAIVNKSERKYFNSLHHLHEIKITTHIVKKGETLSSIARKHHVKGKQICFWNGFRHARNIKPGMKLILWPSHKHSQRHTHHVTYKVRPGDSLSKIAHRYHVSTHQLLKLNHLKTSTIHIGEVLIISIKKPAHKTKEIVTKKTKVVNETRTTEQHRHIKKKTAKTKSLPTKRIKKDRKNTSQPAHQQKQVTYHVQSGDSLSTIAHKFKVKIRDLKRWNRISNPRHLQLNQPIVIYQK